MPSFSETWLTSAALAGRDREAVVLRGHEHALRPGHAHGVVRAAVAERSLNVSRPSASPTSWCPRQMPKSGTRPSSPRTVSTGRRAARDRPGRCRRAPPPARARARRRRPRCRGRPRPRRRLDEPPHDRALAAEVEHDDARARRRPRTARRRTPRAPAAARRAPARRASAASRGAAPRARGRAAPRAAPCRARSASRRPPQAPHERARVDLLERDDAAPGEPGRPRGAGTAHHDALVHTRADSSRRSSTP